MTPSFSIILAQNIFGGHVCFVSGAVVFFYYLGLNALFICMENDTCLIECRGNGCFGVTFACDPVVSSCYVECDITRSLHCPAFDSTISYKIDDDPYNSLIPLSRQSRKLLTTASSINKEIESNCNNDRISLKCDRLTECEDWEVDINMYTPINITYNNISHICCRGAEACAEMQVWYNNNNSVSTNNTENGLTVVCNGDASCDEINVNMIQTTNGGGGGGTRTLVYCGGYKACEDATISNVDTVYCAGSHGCADATMENIDTLIVSSYKGCEGCTLIDVNNIYVTGPNAFDAAIIEQTDYGGDNDTNNDDDSVKTVNLYLLCDEAAEDLHFECNSNSVCNIYCVVSDACIDFMIDCFGPCTIQCDPTNGIDCPSRSNITGDYVFRTVIAGENETYGMSVAVFFFAFVF